ncbi:aminoglycoside N(3)-acetyltransferase [Embleya sp. NPDC050154]|uniref:aminoglycoside N(3)-acetyltransferase n=1 Tax=Embleya sp. NPDC050154 TaxID=3363988 RepID=UPI0037AA8EEB
MSVLDLTPERIAEDTRYLLRDIPPDRTILLHSSLRAFLEPLSAREATRGRDGAGPGVVRSGPEADMAKVVVDGVVDGLGRDATLAVPTFTSWNSLTSHAYRAAVEGKTPEERARIEAALPAFDPATTPSEEVGFLTEVIRRRGFRSRHPQTSFAAIGKRGREIVDGHDPRSHLGEASPLGALYRTPNTHILMAGTDWDTCTAFHLAEYKRENPQERHYQTRVYSPLNGRGEFTQYRDVVLDDSDFMGIGKAFMEHGAGLTKGGFIGGAKCLLVPFKPAVDFAVRYMEENRVPLAPEDLRKFTMQRDLVDGYTQTKEFSQERQSFLLRPVGARISSKQLGLTMTPASEALRTPRKDLSHRDRVTDQSPAYRAAVSRPREISSE